MIIQSATVQMRAQHQLSETQESRLSMQVSRRDAAEPRTDSARGDRAQISSADATQGLANAAMNALRAHAQIKGDESNDGRALGRPAQFSSQGLARASEVNASGQEAGRRITEFEVSLLKLLVERLTGRKIELVSAEAENASGDAGPVASTAEPVSSRNESFELAGWSVSIDFASYEKRSENLSFQTSAHVATADGRKLSLTLSLSYSSSFERASAFSLRAGQAMKDPLVLSYPGQAVELQDVKLDFDLDMDGANERLPLLSGQSAYLALDRNRDGMINHGGELFGALSGDGFADLREFDDDGNGWIDENDAVFSELRLFHPGADGQGQLITLKQGNVGALYLGNVETPFRLTERGSDQVAGQLRSSGLFLTEDGQAGALQQLDVVA